MMLKFDFSVQTRDGQKIDSVVIGGLDQKDAERKLFQMYRQCTVLQCQIKEGDDKLRQAPSIEDILTLIAK